MEGADTGAIGSDAPTTGCPFSYLFNQAAHAARGDMPASPPGTDINGNIDEALRHKGDDLWFYDQVKNKGPWDYKQQGAGYQDFGNFNYGATGAAVGYSEDTLLRMAGWAQVQAGTSRPEWGVAPNKVQAYFGVGGKAPFGDDPNDQKWISRGIQYYRERK